jgi:adenylate kinase family enzyme
VFKLKDIVWAFKGISTFALVGDSGTGKSFRAKLLAQKYAIDVIIDDGLLIREDKILAGHSAKREKTYMGAIRAALFDDKGHRDEVARVLQRLKVKKILILGTSEKMAQKIAVRLQLPPPPADNIIHIEEIASQEEIDKAIRSRRVEGKHVIPVPAVEIKRTYPMIFFDAIRIFHKKKNAANAAAGEKLYEKSVVRPEFSKKGRITISEAALTQMVMHCVMEYDKAVRVKKLSIKTDQRGYRLIITVDVPFGTQLIGEIHNLQEYIIDNIEKYTGILIEEVSIVIDKITHAGKI